MICQYCKKEFKSTSSLNLHIKTAKYCLKIQNKLCLNTNVDTNVDTNEKYKCYVCNKILSTKQWLLSHLEVCTNLYNINLILKDIKEENNMLKEEDNMLKEENNMLKEENKQIQELKEYIIKLETENSIYKKDHECVQNIAKQPRNITNNKILNIISPLDFTSKEPLKNKINDSYKLDYIFSGQKGIAKFAVDHLLKDEEGNLKYVCTDPSRQIFKYKDHSGEIRKDVEAKKLTNFLVEGGIKHKACDIMNEWWTEETGITNVDKFELLVDKAESLKTIDSDNTEFKKELATMTTI